MSSNATIQLSTPAKIFQLYVKSINLKIHREFWGGDPLINLIKILHVVVSIVSSKVQNNYHHPTIM